MSDSNLVKNVEKWCEIDNSFISSRFGTALLWFIVVFITMIVILYITKPNIVLKKDSDGEYKDEIDFSKIFIASTIVGLIIGIIGYLLKNKCVA